MVLRGDLAIALADPALRDPALPAAPGIPAAPASYALARLLELAGPVAAPEEIAADLEPEPEAGDTGHEATVLDLNAARAARSSELASTEEAATKAAAAAHRELLAREQADRDADERAVSDALRLAVAARAARPAAFSTAPFAAVPAAPAFTTPTTAPVPLTAGERLGMFSISRDPLADTASLMRELSSLGDEAGDPAENRPLNQAELAQHAPVSHKAPEKKRKGLFGR